MQHDVEDITDATEDRNSKVQPASAQSWLVLEATLGSDFDGPWDAALLPDGAICIVERGSEGRPPGLSVVTAPDCATAENLQVHNIPLPPGEEPVDDIQGISCVADDDGVAMLLVADLGNHCVHRIELPSGLPKLPQLGIFGPLHDADEALHCPRAIALLERPAAAAANAGFASGPRWPERLICVADAGNGRLQTYDAATLAHVRSIGTPATEPGATFFVRGELEQPLGLAAHGGELYVVDGYRHTVSVFDGTSGRFVRAIGGPGELTSPFGCLVVRGMLLVSEATRLQVFTLDGVRRDVIEVRGSGNLAGLCAGPEHVYACDVSHGCLHRLRLGWADEGDRYAGEMNE